MSEATRVLECYIGALSRPLQEPYLEVNGFKREMIMFAIPAYGVLFRCRAGGNLLDLEFGAFFSLLRFIKTSLASERIKEIRVNSSDPEFVFAMALHGPSISARPGRQKMLEGYLSRFDIEVRFVPRRSNQVYLSPGDMPSTPREQTPPLKARKGGPSRGRFRPIQKGLAL